MSCVLSRFGGGVLLRVYIYVAFVDNPPQVLLGLSCLFFRLRFDLGCMVWVVLCGDTGAFAVVLCAVLRLLWVCSPYFILLRFYYFLQTFPSAALPAFFLGPVRWMLVGSFSLSLVIWFCLVCR